MRNQKIIIVIIFITALLAVSFSREKPQKRALLIGINEYMANPQKNNLRGCENDVNLMKHLLVYQYNFEPRNIKVLKSRNATLSNIRKAIRENLIEKTKPGDLVVFYYSGHGSRVKDKNGDEKDKYDEALCPTDAVPIPGNPKNLLVDDELGMLLGKIPTKNVVVILDSCFSGTATKDFSFQGKIKYMDIEGKSFVNPDVYRGKTIDGKSMSKSADIPWLLISGCASWEKSQESKIKMGNKFMPCGLLTKNIYRTLDEKPEQTYREAHRKMKRAVVAEDPSQTPQLEGRFGDKIVFRVSPPPVGQPTPSPVHTPQASPTLPKPTPTPSPTPSHITTTPATPSPPTHTPSIPPHSVLEVRGNEVLLNIGAAGNVTAGSVYAVFPRNEQQFNMNSKIGDVRIKSVETLKSRADILSGTGKIRRGCRVREVSHQYEKEKLHVLVGDFQHAASIKEKLKNLSYITVVGSMGHADRIIAGSPGGGICAIFARDGTMLEDFAGNNVNSIFPELKKSLESAYIIKRLASLHNPNSNFQVKLDLDEDRTKFKIGEEIGFHFGTDADCYLILLHISSSGQVSLLFPNKYSKKNLIRKGQIYNIPPFRDGKFLFHYRLGGPTGQEMVKAVATREHIDPWGMDMNSVDGVFKEIKGDPVDLTDNLLLTLNRKLLGQKPISIEAISIPTGGRKGSGWATDSVTYVIEKK